MHIVNWFQLNKIMRLKIYWTFVTILWATCIFIVSVIPSSDLPSFSIWEPDKIAHFIVYGLLTFFACKMYLQRNKTMQKSMPAKIYAFASCILYGICIEVIQLFLPTRSFDPFDILANTIGCLLGILAITLSSKRIQNDSR
jgi:hypothetical protein